MEKKRDILPAHHQPLLNARQLATWLNLSKSQVYALALERKIPRVDIDGSLRFDQQDIEKWLESIKVKDDTYRALNDRGWQPKLEKRRA